MDGPVEMNQPNPFADQNPYETPQHTGLEAATGVEPIDTTGDATGGVIPYKNPAALIAYYLGIFGMCPVIGIFASIPAFILGIVGLRRRAQNPAIKGSVHAWIGIILGGVCTLLNMACWGMMILGTVLRVAAP